MSGFICCFEDEKRSTAAHIRLFARSICRVYRDRGKEKAVVAGIHILDDFNRIVMSRMRTRPREICGRKLLCNLEDNTDVVSAAISGGAVEVSIRSKQDSSNRVRTIC